MIKKIIVSMLKAYKQNISSYFIRSCRFYPSCSEYAAEAINEKGLMKGTVLSFWRIARCNPLSRGGHDPVTKKGKEK
ncbi:MAG: membrane protein insertion efficiency factor YidD [Candidatus Omnitrophota bacterium]